jgi:hypothetical protein
VFDPELKGNVSMPTGGAVAVNQTLFCVAASIAFNNLRALISGTRIGRTVGNKQLCPLRRPRRVNIRQNSEPLDVLAHSVWVQC